MRTEQFRVTISKTIILQQELLKYKF